MIAANSSASTSDLLQLPVSRMEHDDDDDDDDDASDENRDPLRILIGYESIITFDSTNWIGFSAAR